MTAALNIDILTLFPEMLAGPLDRGVIGRARTAGLISIASHNIRDWTTDRHRVVDDSAFGGGPGMVMKPEPLAAAIEECRGDSGWVVFLSPQGQLLNQGLASDLSKRNHLVLVCGRYEGVDDRVRSLFIDQEISIGDYVLTGGELPALIVAETVARLVPGVLSKEDSTVHDSHAAGLLEHPHFTRPRQFRGQDVPAVLLSGDHDAIARWRHLESLRRTLLRRPDLVESRGLQGDEERWLWDEEPDAMRRLKRKHQDRGPSGALENRAES